MSIPEMLTLRDGQQVPRTTFNATDTAINTLKNENHFTALHHLAQKCNIENYKIPEVGNSVTILKDRGLIDETGKIQPDVQKIVRNSIKTNGFLIQIINPLQPKDVVKI